MMADATTLRWDALPPLWLLVLVIIPGVFLVARFFYRREAGRVGRTLRIAMAVLRSLAVLLVLVALFGPYAETIESRHFKRHLIVCIDTSGSMAFKDTYRSNPELAASIRLTAGYPESFNLATRPRIEIVKDLLGSDREFLEELADKFRLHIYTFSSQPAGLFEPHEGEKPSEAAERILAELPRLKANGQVTRIGTAIRDLVRAFDAKNEPMAGILLFSDGRHTGGAPGPVDEARRAAEGTRDGIPIFPVAMGDPAAAINIGVSRIDAPEVVLAGDEVAFTVTVHARGLDGRTATLEAAVLDAEGNVKETLPIDAEPFSLPGEKDPPKKVTFHHLFTEHGTYDLRIGVPPEPGEAVEGDNYKRHVLHVAKLKMRVLLVVSKPNYTYRYLSEALFRAEKTIAANALLLSAEPEWPQPASSGLRSLEVFPQERAELAQYDVVILTDVDPRDPRFARGGEEGRARVLGNLEHWVKSGGGLVLQAGRDGYVPDMYINTPVMSLMPVVPYRTLPENRYQEIVELGDEKRYALTNAGADHPVMRILQKLGDTRDFWESNDYATKYLWYAPVERAKSSATVLAVRRNLQGTVYLDRNEPHPLIALQDYGLGKTLWLGTDELWRMRYGNENLYYWRFWSGAIRHLATYRLLGGNKRIKIWVDRADGRYRVGDSVGIEAKFLDENFEPVSPGDNESEQRTLKLRTPDGDEREIPLQAVVTDPPEGIFRTRVSAGRPGTYRLIAESGGEEEPAETTFVVEDTTLEMLDPLMDMRTLEAIARASRGKVLKPSQIRQLISDDIVPRTASTRSGETRRTDLWDRGWVLWLFVLLLGAEWILRRRNLLL